MFKTKKVLASLLAGAMLLSGTAFATEATDEAVAHGDYTVEVNYYKTNADENSSMASYMASTTLPVTVDENGYTITMDFYNYYSTGVTALENLQYSLNDQWVDLTLTSVADEYSHMANASFYDRTVITVASLDDLLLQAYIIPMGEAMPAYATQSWRVVFHADSLTPAGTSYDNMLITATVEKNVSTSSVTIPESTNMGTLSKVEDTVVSYEVAVNEGYGQTVTVSAPETVTLTDGDASLTIANDFDGKKGTLTASAEDVAKVASYEADLSLTGALSFTITVE